MSEVRTVLEGEDEDGTKCHTLHRRYQSLVREYKRIDRRLVECQKKQLEVTTPTSCVSLCLDSIPGSTASGHYSE